MPTQRRPRGPLWQATTEWKAQALAEMETKGISPAELARRVSVSGAAISILFRPSTTMSRLVPSINKVLGIAPPIQKSGVVVDDEDLAELMRTWNDLGDEERKALKGMAAVLAKRKS